jgi:hypothetical protein
MASPTPAESVQMERSASAASQRSAAAAPSSNSRPEEPVSLSSGTEEKEGGNSAASAGAERASRLREENRLLGEAREALRRGDAAGALRKLDEIHTRLPGGVLGQEREALGIEALWRAGHRNAAAVRAAAFLRAYPKSPHAEKMMGFIQ